MSSNDSRSTSSSISPVSIVALLLGAASLILLPFADGFHPFALILAIAAVIAGVAGVVMGRRASATPWSSYIAIGLGVLTIILVAVFAIM